MAENQYDTELLEQAEKPKLFDLGSRLKQLLPLATAAGKKEAANAAKSDLAKKLLKPYVGGRRRTRKVRRHHKKTHRRRR